MAPNYQMIEGLRKDSNLYLSNNKLYKIDKGRGGFVYLRCKEHDKGCKARAFVMDEQVIVSKDHTCTIDENYIKQMKLKSSLKNAAEKGEKTFKSIYDDKTRKAGITVPLPDVISAMKKRRAGVLPANVTTPPKVVAFLEDPSTDEKWKSNYYTFVTHEETSERTGKKQTETAVILQNTGALELVTAGTDTFFLDGTFAICPRLFYQVLNVAAEINGKVTLLFSVAMTCRSKPLYKIVLQAIRSHPAMYNLNIATVYADFESGIASAVAKVIPRARLVGCSFHYSQAIVRKLRSPAYGLMVFYNSDHNVTDTIHLYLTWPYLPRKEMKEGLRRIRKTIRSIKKTEVRLKFYRFHDTYMKTFWYKKIKPRRLSVHGLTRRTTNDLESLHRKMKGFMPLKPSFIRFLHYLKRNIFVPATALLQHITNNEQIIAKPKPKQEHRNELFRSLERKLKDHKITIMKFQERAAKLHFSVTPRQAIEKKLNQDRMLKILEQVEEEDFTEANEDLSSEEGEDDSETDDSDEDPEDALEQSLANERKPVPYCSFCSEELEDFYSNVPCGHSGCQMCLQKWFDINGTCADCRTEVHHVMRVHKPDTVTREQMMRLKEQAEEAQATQGRQARNIPAHQLSDSESDGETEQAEEAQATQGRQARNIPDHQVSDSESDGETEHHDDNDDFDEDFFANSQSPIRSNRGRDTGGPSQTRDTAGVSQRRHTGSPKARGRPRGSRGSIRGSRGATRTPKPPKPPRTSTPKRRGRPPGSRGRKFANNPLPTIPEETDTDNNSDFEVQARDGPRMELPSVSPTPTSSPRPHSQISDTEDEENWPQWNSDTSQDLFTSQSDFTRESSELQSSSRGNSFLEDTNRPSASCGPSTSTATSGATAPPRKKARMSSSSNN